MLLKDKTILVTGASKGIGRSIVIEAAQQGARMILVSRNLALLDQLKSELDKNQDHLVYTCDISSATEVKDMFRQLRKNKVTLDSIVNNAGIMKDGFIPMISETLLKEIYSTNVFGSYYVAQQATKFFLKQKSGSIINVSSIVGVNGNKGQTAYASSKAAIIGLTKSLAKELAPYNVRVNAIAPGFIETDMTKSMPDELYKSNIDMIGMKRIGQPEDIAGTVIFLASNLSQYITGQIIGVDGGFLI